MNEYVLVQNMDISQENMETIQIIQNIKLDTLFAMNSLDFLGLTEKQIWRWYFVNQGWRKRFIDNGRSCKSGFMTRVRTENKSQQILIISAHATFMKCSHAIAI